MSKLNCWKVASAVCVLGAAAAIAAPAQTFATLSFNGTNGANPEGALVQATDGNLYGTTYNGGANNDGTVFKLTPTGMLTTLHSFAGTDGSGPTGLTLGTDGNFYGTTYGGGSDGDGTVFKMGPAGRLETIFNFDFTHGANPGGALVQATDGSFYGTTLTGGVPLGLGCPAEGCGTFFKITSTGELRTLFKFASGGPVQPNGGLVQGADGNFYGTSQGPSVGGQSDQGSVFESNPGGAVGSLHPFSGYPTDGAVPLAGLVLAADGNFYGTTSRGGTYGDGTVFQITPEGKLIILYTFAGTERDGSYPAAPLIQGTDGNFYGTTEKGGRALAGTIFSITPTGTLTTLHTFDVTDGSSPVAGLVQDTSGVLYGTTSAGGTYGDGTIFWQALGRS